MPLFLVEAMPTLEEPYSGRCDGIVIDDDGVEYRFYDERFDSVVQLYTDCRYGDEQCPPEHQEAFDAARAARAIREHG